MLQLHRRSPKVSLQMGMHKAEDILLHKNSTDIYTFNPEEKITISYNNNKLRLDESEKAAINI